MFGKGVYFADMVSKSANYCFTNSNNNTGLLILNEVFLFFYCFLFYLLLRSHAVSLIKNFMLIIMRISYQKAHYQRKDVVELPLLNQGFHFLLYKLIKLC